MNPYVKMYRFADGRLVLTQHTDHIDCEAAYKISAITRMASGLEMRLSYGYPDETTQAEEWAKLNEPRARELYQQMQRFLDGATNSTTA